MGEWRVGRSVGRTLYIDDELVGLMDTPELAKQVVEAINGAPAPADDTAEVLAGLREDLEKLRHRDYLTEAGVLEAIDLVKAAQQRLADRRQGGGETLAHRISKSGSSGHIKVGTQDVAPGARDEENTG